eukprot:9328466-Pyramimonas_sp.AAC.1
MGMNGFRCEPNACEHGRALTWAKKDICRASRLLLPGIAWPARGECPRIVAREICTSQVLMDMEGSEINRNEQRI